SNIILYDKRPLFYSLMKVPSQPQFWKKKEAL
ncbi:hypothetical protein AVEN_102683-1, partial [Araneus ventricosus]